jgi:hypothetical protein
MQERFLTTAEGEAWQRCLPASRSVFGSLGYATICERFRGVSARLHVVESDAGSICHPMLLRPLSGLPFAVSAQAMSEAKCDAATPDYTGPLVQGEGMDVDQWRKLHGECMRREGIVAEFAHLHPWCSGRELLGDGCSYNRDIVWVDVAVPPDQLYRKHFEHACRKNIQKALREGVKTFVGDSDEHVREFHRIYSGTMQRNNALDRYAFSLDYFRAFRDELPENARFVFAEHNGRILAATLYLHDDTDVYSFLGGADAEFNPLRPTNLVVWDTIGWAHGTGKKRLVLGGGYGVDDGIFRFKATFSPLRQPFYLYKKIHLAREYALLDQQAREHNGLKDEDVGYFPSYRYSKPAA